MYNTNTHELLKEPPLKRGKLRHNEYYNTQAIFDNLYKQSQAGSKFTRLFDLISSDANILLAYRNIKANSGSKTPGVNHHTIKFWKDKPIEKFIAYIKSRLMDYKPLKVRRVMIPKPLSTFLRKLVNFPIILKIEREVFVWLIWFLKDCITDRMRGVLKHSS